MTAAAIPFAAARSPVPATVSKRKPKRPYRQPDIATLIAMIAAACLATMAELALVLTAPLIVIWIASLLPVLFWAILLREVHRFLRDGQTAEPPTAVEPPSGPPRG